jgi:Icc-related predicted phosphoesterase
MKIVCLSDTHQQHRNLVVPAGDLLIHAGDITMNGSLDVIRDFNTWLGELPHRHKVMIAGNHDRNFERQPETRALITNAIYLEESGCTIEGLKFWGSPISPWFFDWSFNRQRGADIKRHWDAIPRDTQVLITHGPPRGMLDTIRPGSGPLGCDDLAHAVAEVKPLLHVFGHIHGGYGVNREGITTFVNASMVNEEYKTVHPPICVTLEELKTSRAKAVSAGWR